MSYFVLKGGRASRALASRGTRLVLATESAAASVTLNDIDLVINTCVVTRPQKGLCDPAGFACELETKASMEQKEGRAARSQDGSNQKLIDNQ